MRVTLALAVLLATALARLQFPSQCVNGACGVVKFVALSSFTCLLHFLNCLTCFTALHLCLDRPMQARQ